MATMKGIILVPANATSGTPVKIMDTVANIDTLWTTASTLVNGYMDFTSVLPGVYAQKADGVTGLTLNDAGTTFVKFTAYDGAEHFDLSISVDPTRLPAFQAVDGAPPISQLQEALNQVIQVLKNRGIGYPAS